MRAILLVVSILFGVQAADPPRPAGEPPPSAAVAGTIAQAQDWLLGHQRADGALVPGPQFVISGTAFALHALLMPPHALPADDPRIQRAVALLMRHRQADGGFYEPREGLGDYTTSFTLMALAALGHQGFPADPEVISGAQNYLFALQNQQPGDRAQFGIGYGNHQAGDENVPLTTPAVQALIESGVPASDPRLQHAIKFLERCQHLTTVNSAPSFTDDGRASYSPKVTPSDPSPADQAAESASLARGVVPGYGSVTYAMICTYLMLDLRPEDPRVATALGWCLANYRFDANPGMRPAAARQGLYHYHALMARTFGLLGRRTLTLPDGRIVDWRADLYAAITAESHRADATAGGTAAGTASGLRWVNSAPRWGEALPEVGTTYAIVALKHIAASLAR